MLQKLHVQNYAIIDELTIHFSSNLNIITGETGAGKSILIGAMSLILGERADTSILLHHEKKCFIEGVFGVTNKKEIQHFLQENNFDETNDIILRREISANGKSRAFINDTPASLQQLKQLASLLVDLHQQFDSLELGNSNFQREIIDALANNQTILPSYQIQYQQWLQAKRELEELQNKKNKFNKEFDYHQFLFNELTELNLQENELENLESELKLLSNSEDIKIALTKAYISLNESEQPLIQSLKQIINQITNYSSLHPSLATIIERLHSAQIELSDIAYEIDSTNNSIHFDEERIQLVNERLSSGYKLLKKHGVTTTAELLKIQHELSEKLKNVLAIDDAIIIKEKEVNTLLQQAITIANSLSTNRKNKVQLIEEKIHALLIKVGMPNAKIKIKITETNLYEFGQDVIEFLFDANKSNKYESLRKVASGGELSRLMLCIKSLVAQHIDLPTMIFDEIDTGISGEAAKQVGIIMKELSKQRQIICITHQPQIAGKADAHYFVYKEVSNSGVTTSIKLLDKNERILSIAKMLSGEKPTAAALENAKEMLQA